MLGDQLLASERDLDRDEIVAVSTTPGPAGSVALQLGRIRVDIDAADLRLVNAITVDEVSEIGAPELHLLETLVGPTSASAILDALPSDDHGGEWGNPRRLTPLRGVRTGLAQAAILATAIASPGFTDLERALARLQAATLLGDLGLPRSEDLSSADLEDAAALVLEQGERAWRGLNSDEGDIVANALLAAPGDPHVRAALARLADHVRAPLTSPALDVAIAAARPQASDVTHLRAVERGPQREVSSAIDSLDRLVGLVIPSVRWNSGDEMEIRMPRCAGRTEGWWARVFHGERGTPLAVVPLMRDHDDAVATFLLGGDESHAMFDLVLDPSTPRVSSQLSSFRLAVAHGSRAARLERLGDYAGAADEWARCSDLHQSAGDSDRSSLAAVLADQRRRTSGRGRASVVGPVVSDVLGPLI